MSGGIFCFGILAGTALKGHGLPAAGQIVLLATIFLGLSISFLTARPSR